MSELRYAEIVEQSVVDGVDWDDFRVFLEVVHHGSFNRAAIKLKMTQPTVSRRLLRLEKAIGVRLFDRDRRGPRLTYEGQRIYNDASAAQVALTRAANQAASAANRVDGDCKLFMGDGIASYWMTRFLAPFFSRYPNIELKLFGAHDSSVDKREMFDLHVHYYEPAEADPIAIRVGTMHFVPFGSRDYLARHGTPRGVEDLGRHRLLDLAVYLADMGSWASWSREEAATHTVLFTNLSACLAEVGAPRRRYRPVADLCRVGGRRLRAAGYRGALSGADLRLLSARRDQEMAGARDAGLSAGQCLRPQGDALVP